MLPQEHLEKARRIEATCEKLNPDTDWETIIEESYGIAINLLAYLSENKFGTHIDTHKGLAKFLDNHGMIEESKLLRELDLLRSARWYGGRGNGDAARRAKAIILELEKIIGELNP